MTTVTIYHNPRCSKSRQTLQLLRDNGIDPRIIEYLKSPPTKSELNSILKMLGMEPRDLMRKQENEYKQDGLDDPDLNRNDLIQAMLQHPVLIERPIVISKNKAVIGRPPENVLAII